MSQFNGENQNRRKVLKASQVAAVKSQIMALVKQLEPPDQAELAGTVLDWAGIDEERFRLFWSQLDEADRETLAGWISMVLDGDVENEPSKKRRRR